MVNYKVSKIIDLVTRTWNTSEIKTFLVPFEVEAIECLPLSVCGAPYAIIWSNSPYGVFSVQSAYRLLLQNEGSAHPRCSSLAQKRMLWKSIWGLSLTPSIRNFLWGACSGALPTKIALWKRNVLPKPICDQCRMRVEDTMHALWSCPELAFVWPKESWLGPLLSRTFLDFTDLISSVLASCSQSESALFGSLAWLIWNVRNKKRLQQSGGTLEGINQRVYDRVEEFTTLHSSGPVQTVMPHTPKHFRLIILVLSH
ncbi:putative ribonuclease H protein At1g65750 isoform X1 [Fagus crenata]